MDEKADIDKLPRLIRLVFNLIKYFVSLAIWIVLLPFRIVIGIMWYIFSSIIHFIFRRFYAGIWKYGFATIIFISGAIALLRYDEKVRKYIEKHRNAQ